MFSNLLIDDLNHVLLNTESLWEDIRDQRIFITGGTGFFGCWLLETFAFANERLNLNAHAVVLTRNIENFKAKCPELVKNASLSFIEGDVRDFNYPAGNFSYIIHAATEASVSLNKNNPNLMFDTIIEGTRHTLEFARQCRAHNFLLISSGAVYGNQPHDVSKFAEDYIPQPNFQNIDSAYAEGKRQSEQMCLQYAKQYHFDMKIARCFAFVGPHLPLDTHFAIGNFIRDGLSNQTISVQSDGTSLRTYLYASDLAIWLWTILFRGESMRFYNVGSDVVYSIREVAHLVAKSFGQEVNILNPASGELATNRYIPDISRAQLELGLTQKIDLMQAIHLMKKWYSFLYKGEYNG